MSAGGPRPVVGILDADPEACSSLEEWLRAAGFASQRVTSLRERVAVTLVRWPVRDQPELQFAAAVTPLVLLADRAAMPPQDVVARAVEVVPLPDASDVKSLLGYSSQLIAVLRQVTTPHAEVCRVPEPVVDAEEQRKPPPALIAIGVSTGGPLALQELFGSLRGAALPPLVLVQHIPPNFLGVLIERLERETGCRSELAAEGTLLRPGVAYFAPGDRHLRVTGDRTALRAKLTEEPPRRGHRPAAEILFESCAELPLRGIGVIMTGMGQDGAQALLRLRQKGWATLGQSEATCAIYGMPRAAKQLGAVAREVALADLGTWLQMLCRPRRVVAAGPG